MDKLTPPNLLLKHGLTLFHPRSTKVRRTGTGIWDFVSSYRYSPGHRTYIVHRTSTVPSYHGGHAFWE